MGSTPDVIHCYQVMTNMRHGICSCCGEIGHCGPWGAEGNLRCECGCEITSKDSQWIMAGMKDYLRSSYDVFARTKAALELAHGGSNGPTSVDVFTPSQADQIKALMTTPSPMQITVDDITPQMAISFQQSLPSGAEGVRELIVASYNAFQKHREK